MFKIKHKKAYNNWSNFVKKIAEHEGLSDLLCDYHSSLKVIREVFSEVQEEVLTDYLMQAADIVLLIGST